MAYTGLATKVYKDPLTVQWMNSVKGNDDYLITGAAKFWAKVDGATATITAVAFHNLSSITDNAGNGDLTFGFVTGFSTTNFACLCSAARSGAAATSIEVAVPYVFTTASVRCIFLNVSDVLENPTNATVACFGVLN